MGSKSARASFSVMVAGADLRQQQPECLRAQRARGDELVVRVDRDALAHDVHERGCVDHVARHGDTIGTSRRAVQGVGSRVVSASAPTVVVCACCTPPTGTWAWSLHREDLLAAQGAYVDHSVEVVRAEAVDVVLVAGDVYDRALPGVDAVKLCNDATRAGSRRRAPGS